MTVEEEPGAQTTQQGTDIRQFASTTSTTAGAIDGTTGGAAGAIDELASASTQARLASTQASSTPEHVSRNKYISYYTGYF